VEKKRVARLHFTHYYFWMGKLATTRPDGLQIKTPQALIHIRHKISLLQYKYWILMLRELRRQFDADIGPDEKGFRSLSMGVVAEALGYTPNKSQLWDDLLALKNETIAYNVLSKDGGQEKYGAGFISEWKVHSSRIEFKFPSFIEDVVHGLDAPKAIFQLLNWEIFNHFSGKYEAIIYKLCRDYRGVKKTPYFDIAKFREYMGLETTEYKEFRDLNKFVISTPIKTINASEASDILVQAKFERQGRKVIGLWLLIESKAQTMIPFPDEPSEAFRFAKVHIESAMRQKYLEMRSEEEIQLCIARANEYGEQQAKKGSEPSYGALYRKAITDGWHVHQLEIKEKEKKTAQRRKATEVAIQTQEAESALRDKDALDKMKNAFDRFNSLPEVLQDEIREAFRSTLKVIALRKSFDKQGENAPVIRSQFAEYFLDNEPAPLEAKPKKSSAK
jgi:plasmid replication initiation protein